MTDHCPSCGSKIYYSGRRSNCYRCRKPIKECTCTLQVKVVA